jgi:hypothetical protein
MIWVQHDFYSNFIQGTNSKNIELGLDIFRSEISDLLTYKSDGLYGLFDKLKIKYKKKSSYEELLDIILREMKVNEKFIRGLSFLIGESNNVIKNNPKISWDKLLDKITIGIKKINKYFIDNPRKEMLFKRRTIDMIGLKSSITGNDSRELNKKDNTVLWIFGIVAVGIAGYLVYRYFDNKKQARLRAESLQGVNPMLETGGSIVPEVTGTPMPQMNTMSEVSPVQSPTSVPNAAQSLDPAFNVANDVLIPEPAINSFQPNNSNINGSNVPSVNIQVQTMPNTTPLNS